MENTQCTWEKTEIRVRQSFTERNVGKGSLQIKGGAPDMRKVREES
jgi:hypothetical protein